jgi:hypothetical protein
MKLLQDSCYNQYFNFLLKASFQNMNPDEFTQCFNLAKAVGLVVSSRRVEGVLYVYTTNGMARSWDSFTAEYPLERLQSLVSRMQFHR